MDWLNNAELKAHFPLSVDGSAIVRSKVAGDIQGLIGNVILSSHVASSMVSNQFGTPGFGWQRAVTTTAIDDSKAYLQDMAVKSRNLLRSKIGGMSGNAKVHYQALLIKLNNALKDKL